MFEKETVLDNIYKDFIKDKERDKGLNWKLLVDFKFDIQSVSFSEFEIGEIKYKQKAPEVVEINLNKNRSFNRNDGKNKVF